MIFKYFKNSPLKLSELQKEVKKEESTELALSLDVKTRWNSILPMVQRYLKINPHIRKTLELFNDAQIFTTRYDDSLHAIHDALEPVNEAILTLSKHNSNLMVAEIAVKFIYQRLKESKTKLANDLADAVLKRYQERRNKEIVSLLFFLHTQDVPKSTIGFEYSSRSTIKRTANDLMLRLFPENKSQETEPKETTDLNSFSNIQEGINQLSQQSAKKVDINLDKDLKLFECTGERSNRLSNLHKALMTIKPTSTVCEQNFSVAGSFKTKLRNRMSSEKLNILVWLKYFFAHRNQ